MTCSGQGGFLSLGSHPFSAAMGRVNAALPATPLYNPALLGRDGGGALSVSMTHPFGLTGLYGGEIGFRLPFLKGRIFPSRLRVPSGKISTDTPFRILVAASARL